MVNSESKKGCVCAQSLSHIWHFETPWTVAHQAPLSMGFSRQGYWSGLPFTSPGGLSDSGIEPGSPALQADSLLTELQGKQMVKHMSTMQETWVRFLGWEDPLEKEMAIHSSTIAWKIPWTEEPGRLQSMGSQRVGHDRAIFTIGSWLDTRRARGKKH